MPYVILKKWPIANLIYYKLICEKTQLKMFYIFKQILELKQNENSIFSMYIHEIWASKKNGTWNVPFVPKIIEKTQDEP